MTKKNWRKVHGVFLLDKAQGVSSNGIMQQVKRLFKAEKAGHTGALDPLATGMLPICLGEATKFSQYLLDSDKGYVVTAKLGERTDSSDADGKIVQTREVLCDLAEIEEALSNFRGDILQVPTMFSALKHKGKPLYEYARLGIVIDRPARPITIFEIKILAWQKPFLMLEVHCSKGTYIRTLIDDLGEKLGCGAYVAELRRIRVANFPAKKMLTITELEKLAEAGDLAKLDELLLPIDSPVLSLPSLDLGSEIVLRLQQGQRVKFTNSENLAGEVRIFNDNQFIGIAKIEENLIRPQRMCNI